MDANLQTPRLPGSNDREWVELPAVTPAATSVPHKLGRVPSAVSVRFRALVDGGNGVEKGMELDVLAHNSEASYGGHEWLGLWVSDKEVTVSLDSATRTYRMPDNTVASINYANGNWEMVIRVQ